MSQMEYAMMSKPTNGSTKRTNTGEYAEKMLINHVMIFLLI